MQTVRYGTAVGVSASIDGVCFGFGNTLANVFARVVGVVRQHIDGVAVSNVQMRVNQIFVILPIQTEIVSRRNCSIIAVVGCALRRCGKHDRRKAGKQHCECQQAGKPCSSFHQ